MNPWTKHDIAALWPPAYPDLLGIPLFCFLLHQGHPFFRSLFSVLLTLFLLRVGLSFVLWLRSE